MDWFSRLKMKQRNELYRDPAIADYKRADDRLEQLAERSRNVPNKSDILALAKKDYGEHLMTYTAKPIHFNASLIHEAQKAGAASNPEDDPDYDSDAASISSSISENSHDDSKVLAAKRHVAEAITRATKTAIRLEKAAKSGDVAKSEKLYGKWKTENKEKRTAVANLKRGSPATGVRRKLEAALSAAGGTPTPPEEEAKTKPEGALTKLTKAVRHQVDKELEEDTTEGGVSLAQIAQSVTDVIGKLGERAKRWAVVSRVAKELGVPKTPAMRQRIQDVVDTKRGKAPSTHAPPPTTETAQKALTEAGLLSYRELQKAITKRYGRLSATKRKGLLDRYKAVNAIKETTKDD